MVGTLESINNDTPFLLTERKARVVELRYIETIKYSTSENLEEFLKPIKLKMTYCTIESYRDEITFDSETYNVEVFRLGRVGLYARTQMEDIQLCTVKKRVNG